MRCLQYQCCFENYTFKTEILQFSPFLCECLHQKSCGPWAVFRDQKYCFHYYFSQWSRALAVSAPRYSSGHWCSFCQHLLTTKVELVDHLQRTKISLSSTIIFGLFGDFLFCLFRKCRIFKGTFQKKMKLFPACLKYFTSPASHGKTMPTTVSSPVALFRRTMSYSCIPYRFPQTHPFRHRR